MAFVSGDQLIGMLEINKNLHKFVAFNDGDESKNGVKRIRVMIPYKKRIVQNLLEFVCDGEWVITSSVRIRKILLFE